MTASAGRNSQTPRTRLKLPPLSVWLAAVGLAPLAALLFAGLFGSDGGETARLAETRLPGMAWASLALGIGTALGVGVLGTGLAWLVAAYRFPGRGFFDWALMLPLAVPGYVLAYAYLDLTTAAGPLQAALRDATGWRFGSYVFPEVQGLGGAVFIFSLCFYPYVYALARTAFAIQGASTLEAARTLGMTHVQAFWRIALPLARPALIAGCTLAVLEALADYGAVVHLGVPTFTVGILRAWSAAGEPVAAARLAILLVVVCLALLAIERAARGRGERFVENRTSRSMNRRPLLAWHGPAATALCLVVLFLALVLPGLHLAGLAWDAGPARGVGAATLRTLLLAAGSALILCAIGFGIASAARRGEASANRIRALLPAGYATPGAAAALGVLALAGALQTTLGTAAASIFVGPVLLLLAYQTRFAAAAFGPIETALGRTPASLDHSARVLGCRQSELKRRVHWPIGRAGIGTAALLVFVEIVKELPATIILRPFDFDTLAVLAHAYASEERLAQAASPALAIVLLCAPAMVIAARATRSKRAGQL
ncbi:MAG: ABC transporter permease [Alphaproteobacteria bacterium]